jgi:putative flippase GtrA
LTIAGKPVIITTETCFVRKGALRLHVLEQIRHHFFTREFLLFLIVGCINTFNGTLLTWIYAFALPSNLAFNCAYITSNVLAYGLNSAFIFHEVMSVRRGLKFAVSYIPNYLIQNAIVFIAYNLLGIPLVISSLIAAVLGIPVTFLMVKIFAFNRG